MSAVKLSDSLETGYHKQLSALAGEWQGSTKTWFEPDKVHDESPAHGTIKPLLGGRFLLHEYKGSFEGKPLEGFAIIGFHLLSGTFQCAWIDSFHMGTGILFSESTPTENLFSALGHYGNWEGFPEKWGWRTVINMQDENNMTITAYNISPEGEEQIATQTEYKRI